METGRGGWMCGASLNNKTGTTDDELRDRMGAEFIGFIFLYDDYDNSAHNM